MIIFQNLSVTNGLSYRNLSLNLDNQGLVLIDGSNGAGKSSIWELLTHTLFGVTTKGVANNDIINKYIGQDYASFVNWVKDGNQYSFEQYRQHDTKGTCVEFFENKINIKTKTNRSENKDTQKLVGEKLGLTVQEYYGTVYLCQDYTHDLINGKPSEKQQYLIRYFGLEKLDKLLLDLKERSVSVTSTNTLQSFDESIEQLTHDLANYRSLDALNQQAIELEASKKQLAQKVTNTQRALVTISVLEKQWLAYETKLGALQHHALYNQQIPIQQLQAQQKQNYAQLRTLLTYAKTVDTHNKIKWAQSRFKQLDPNTFDQLQQQQDACEKLLEAWHSDQPKLTKLAQLQANLGEAPMEWTEKLANKLHEASTKFTETSLLIKQAEHELQNLHQIKDNCPQCLRSVSQHEHAAWINTRQQALAALKKQKQRFAGIMLDLSQAKDEHEQHVNKLASITLLQASLRNASYIGIEEAQTNLQALKQRLDSHKQYTELEETLPMLSMNLSLDEAKQTIAELEARNLIVDEYIKLASQVGDKPAPFDPAEVVQLQQAVINLQATEQGVTEELTKIKFERDHVVMLTSNLAKVQTERTNAVKKLTRQKVLKTLHVSVKDLRALKLHQATKLLVSVLPNYVRLLFPNESVSVDVSDDETTCDIIFNKGDTSIALKALSGGQGRKLGLAILFAFTKLLNRQSNLLVCDEPYANLDAHGRAACFDLLRDLLSERQQVNSIFVMSHDQDTKNQRYDKKYTVQYDGKFSELQAM